MSIKNSFSDNVFRESEEFSIHDGYRMACPDFFTSFSNFWIFLKQILDR